jgi:SAM-dependent MidA family methyltransferase
MLNSDQMVEPNHRYGTKQKATTQNLHLTLGWVDVRNKLNDNKKPRAITNRKMHFIDCVRNELVKGDEGTFLEKCI